MFLTLFQASDSPLFRVQQDSAYGLKGYILPKVARSMTVPKILIWSIDITQLLQNLNCYLVTDLDQVERRRFHLDSIIQPDLIAKPLQAGWSPRSIHTRQNQADTYAHWALLPRHSSL